MTVIDKAWIRKNFSCIDLGDLRLNHRALKVAKACARHPGASLPGKFDKWAEVKGAYRLLDHSKVTHPAIQSTHWQETITQARQSDDPILFIQDGSELLYNNHRYTFGLGPTADSQGNGMMIHTCLATRFAPDFSSEILGLGYQECWVRSHEKKDEKESALWAKSLAKIGVPPKTHHWISIGDRGNDIFTFFKEAKQLGWGFIVRAKHNRHIVVAGEKKRLHTWVRGLTTKSSFPLYLRARGKEFSGEVELRLSWAQATITSSHGELEAPLTYLRVYATGGRKLEWILVTNLSVGSAEDALKIVEMYRARWLIEEYHKALKSGCKLEECQMRYAHRLEALLGFLGIVATRLLACKQCCRLLPMQPATKAVSKEMILIVTRYFKVSSKGLIIREFWRLVARLGGFLARKSDGDPGWQTTWKGFMRLQDMMLGFSLI